MLGYDSDFVGVGLLGNYYDNSLFKGDITTRLDDEVDFYWNNEKPHENINQNNFSVVWTGFIKAPVSGDYIFELENDDGGIVLVNNDVVIKDRIKPGQVPTD